MTDADILDLAKRADSVAPERAAEWAPILRLFSSNGPRNLGIVEGILAAARAVQNREDQTRLSELASLAGRRAVEKKAEIEAARHLLESPAALERSDAELERIAAGQAKGRDACDVLREMEERMQKRPPTSAGEDAA